MSDIPKLTRNELFEVFKSHKMVKSFETLLDNAANLTPADVETLTAAVSAGALSSDAAYASSNVALGLVDTVDGLQTQIDAINTDIGNIGQRVLQTVYAPDTGTSSGVALIPFDNTIPQITEGLQVMTATITTTSATSVVVVDCVAHLGSNATPGTTHMSAALFLDGATNAVAAGAVSNLTSSQAVISLRHEVSGLSVGSDTFTVRGGANVSGTMTFNGFFGGTMASYIKLSEIEP